MSTHHGRVRAAWLLGAALGCTTVLACSGPAPATAPTGTSSAAPGASPSSTTAVSVAIPEVTVTVGNPGTDPGTTPTTYATPRADQQVELNTSSSVTQTAGTNPPTDQSVPDLTLPLSTHDAGAAGNGARTVVLRVGTPRSPDDILNNALAKGADSTPSLTVNSSGAVDKLTLDPPAELSDAARSAMEQALRQATQFAPVLPATPIGVGAEWTASQQIVVLGLAVRQDTVYTLTARNGDTLDLGVKITQTALTPTWTPPNTQGKLNVDTYTITGNGTLTVALSKALPVNGQVRLAGKEVFSRPKDGLKLAQTVSNEVAWKS